MLRPPLPERFEDKLYSLFNGRVRCRWSHKRNEWHLEYKVATGKAFAFNIGDKEADHVIRARDGYMFIMAIQPGDRMACPKCGNQINVPVHRTAETVCTYCRVLGRDGRVTAAYYDLNGELIFDHLRKIDPMRDWRKGIVAQMDDNNRRILADRERDTLNKIESATKDNYKDLVSIPTFGYTKQFTG